MAIEERDAFQLFQTLETLPEDMRPRAAGVLADYRNQQTAAGLPLWPSQEAARADERKRVYEVFDNPLTLDKEDGSFIQADRVQPGLGDTLRKREASIMWLANRYGADEMDVRNRLDLYKADASQKWGAGLLDDSAFFSRAKTEIDAERKKADDVKLASMTGIESSLWGGDGFAEASKFQASKPDASPDEQDAFWRSFNEFNAVLDPRRDMVKKATEAMRRMQQGEASDADKATMEELTWAMTEATGKEREIMKRAVVLGARKVAEEGKRGVGGTFTGSASNLIESMFGGARRGEQLAREFDPTQPQPVGPVNTVQDALKAMDTMARAQFSEQVPYDPDAPALPEARVLTPEERKLFTDAKAKVKDLFKVERELKKIALMTDPMDDSVLGTMASGTASTLTLALPLAMGPQGILMAAGGYANMEKEELLTEYPDMQPEDATKVAVLSGGLQAVMDKAQLFGLGKFAPNVRKMLTEGMTRELVKRAIAQGGATFAFENIVEAAQDLTTPVVQQLVSDLSESVPGVDWQKEFEEFAGSRLDVAIGMLPLMLIGAGANTAMDRDSVLALLADDRALAEAGVVESDRVAVLELARDGKAEEAQTKLKEAWERRSPELAAEMGNEKEAEIINAQNIVQKAIDDRILPRARKVGRLAEGWIVEDTLTGNIVKVPTREEAIWRAFSHLDEQEQRRAQAGAQLWDELYEKGGMGDEALRAESASMDTQKQAARSPEDAARVARGIETYAQLHGIPLDEARKIVFTVNGFNKDEQIENVRTAVSSVFGRGMNVATVLHETTHGRWRAGLESGRFTHDQGLAWVRLAEQATGIDFLPSKDDTQISESLLDEAIVDVTVADAIGRRKDGGKFSAGLISRGMAAMARGERSQAKEAGTFATWLKAWKEFWGQVIQKGKALRKAKAEGKLGEDYDAFLDELMQASPQRRHEAAAAKEAMEIAQEGNMPFSLGRAVPADASNVIEMPDGAQLVGPTSFSLRAYHGTPHKVDKFSMGKIGTGEGAQAYGWGLYFAESEVVAKTYRGAWSTSPADHALTVVGGYSGSEAKAIDYLQTVLPDDGETTYTGESRDFILSAIQSIKDGTYKGASSGNLYTVELLPDADEFLDWDRPLSEQSEKVKAALAEMWQDWINQSPLTLENGASQEQVDAIQGSRGSDFYEFLAEDDGAETDQGNIQAASEHLASLGIPGIRYLDGNSRDGGSGTSNYVIFDESLVKILEENGRKVEASSFSLAPKDAEHLAAVESGDMVKAQAMVDEAAKAAGGEIRFRSGGGFLNDDGFLFLAEDEDYAANFGDEVERFYAFPKSTLDLTRWAADDEVSHNDFVAALNENGVDTSGLKKNSGEPLQQISQRGEPKGTLAKAIREAGFDSLRINEYVEGGGNNESLAMLDDSLVDDADPVTRDESGQVIPLSQRFNEASPDIRFSLAPRSLPEVADTILAAQMKRPAFFEAFVTLARRKMEKLWKDGDWRVDKRGIASKRVGFDSRMAGVRSADNIENERKFRLRSRQRELIDEGMLALAPETLAAYDAGVASLEDVPIVSDMLGKVGKIMSKSAAQKAGKLKTDGVGSAGDYDGAPRLPPAWYAKSGGSMPYEIAQQLSDMGHLKDGYADTLWDALRSAIYSTRTANEGFKKARDAVRKVEADALAQARKESDQWAKAETAKIPTEKDRQMMALRTLDAILSAFPPEIRAKVGGFVKLAEHNSDAAREKEIIRRLAKLEEVIEEEAKKHYAAKIGKMLDKAAPVGKPGEVKKSKFIVTVQDEIDAISEMIGMDSDDVADSISKNEAAIISAQTPEAADAALTELNLLEIFGGVLDIKRTSSQELEVASDYLEELLKQGREARKMIDEARRERVKEMVNTAKSEAFKGDAGPETTQAAKAAAAKKSGQSMLKKFFNELSGFDAVLRDAFGADSKTARDFSERFTLNSNNYEDVQNERRKRFRDFARELYGTKLGAKINQKLITLERIENNSGVTYLKSREVKAHKLTLDDAAKIVADPKALGFTAKDAAEIQEEMDALVASKGRRNTFTYEQVTNEGDRTELPLSQMDALYISMALRQPGILEQQQRYGYDQETVDQLEKFLTDETKGWREWMQGEYDAEYQRANEVYMRMFNARMPKLMFYAPLLKNHQGQQAILDPLNTGISSNSANPGSIKSRKARTSSLRIDSALSVFWSHFNQMEYWISNAEYLRDVQSVMLHPDVRQSVVSAHGEDGMATVSAWVQLQMSRGVGKATLATAGSKMFRNVKSAISMKALALNLSTTLKTIPSVFYSLGEIHMSKWPAALVSGMKHWDRLWKTNIIQRRLDIGGMPELRELGSSALPMSWVNQGIRYGSYPTMYADGVFTTYSAAMAYGTSFDEAKRQGAGDEVAHTYAEERTALIVSKTAQPENWTQKSLFENDASGAGTLYFMFTSDPRQKLALTGEALNQWRKGGATTEEAMRKLLAYWIIPGIMFQLANAVGRSLFKGDDDEWELVDFATAALAGQLQGLALIGSAAEIIFSAAIAAAAEMITGEEVKRKPVWNSPKNPLDQAAQELVKSVQKITEDDVKDGPGKAWEITKSAGMLLAPLTPAGAIPSTAERVMKDTTNLFYDDGNK